MCCFFINDLDASAGLMGGTTQYTVNNQMVNATLMNIADNPTNVQLPGMYDDKVRKFVEGLGVEKISRRLVNSREGPPVFEQPEMTLKKLMEYGNMLVMEQENAKRVQLADQYLNEAALGDANANAIDCGTFFGQTTQA